MGGNWKPQTLYEFEKNTGEVVRFSLTEYHGHRLVDVRVYYEDDQGQWLPTKKGISVSTKLVDDLLIGLSKLKEALDGS